MKRAYSTNDINQLYDYVNNNDIISLKRATLNGINLNIIDKNKQSLLHLAAKLGYLSIVKFLIQYGLDYKLKDIHGNTALDISIKYNKYQITKFLSTINITNKITEQSCIFNSIKEGNLHLLKFLLEETDNYDIEDDNKNSLLHQAVISNQLKIVEYLVLDKKIDVNKKNIWNITPLEEAVLSDNTTIANFLRDNNAYYHVKSDSEQIIIGQRNDYFDKLDLIMILISNIYNSTYKLIQFYHTTYNSDYLFCCSKHLSKNKIMTELYNLTSNIIFENDYNLFEKNIIINCKQLKQKDFIFAPYCKSYNIDTLLIIPFNYKNKLLGYFIVWSEHIEKLPDLTNNIISKVAHAIIENDYKYIITLSGNIFIESIKFKIIKKYLDDLLIEIYKRDSYHFGYTNKIFIDILLSLEKDWQLLITNDYFKKIVNAIIYQYNINIPIKPSLYIYNTNSNLIESLLNKKIINNFKLSFENKNSPIYNDLLNFYSNLKIEKLNTLNLNNITKTNIKLFDQRDIFDIIGDHTYNYNIIDYINGLLKNDEIQWLTKEIIIKLGNLLGGTIRNSNVIGVAMGNQYCLFMHYQEINKAINFILNSINSISDLDIIKKIYFFYTGMVEYVHPFNDCNGRVFRILTNVLLRKIGINKIIYKKIMSYREFIDFIK